MVYPVSGYSQQTIPAANTFQPGVDARRPDENRFPDATRPSGTDAARSEASSTRSNNRPEDSRALYASNSRSVDSGAVRSSSSRGTELDIVV